MQNPVAATEHNVDGSLKTPLVMRAANAKQPLYTYCSFTFRDHPELLELKTRSTDRYRVTLSLNY